jgi:hypothetical protein
VQFQIKCLHLRGLRSLTLSELPKLVPFPREADGAKPVMTSSSDSTFSMVDAITLVLGTPVPLTAS